MFLFNRKNRKLEKGKKMTKILHINASPRGAESKSLAIANAWLASAAKVTPGLEVETWNVFDEELPDYGTAAAAAKMNAFAGQELSSEQAEEWAKGQAVFNRFANADIYLFNVPMWNHGVPYPLKQLIDILTQPGWLFGFDMEKGYFGMLKGKRAFSIYTSGVYQSGGPEGFGKDFQSTFFEDWLHFIGIDETTAFYHSKNNLSYPDDQAAALAKACEEASAIATKWITK